MSTTPQNITKFFPYDFVSYFPVVNHKQIKAEILPHILHSVEYNEGKNEYKWDIDSGSNMVTTYRTDLEKAIFDLVAEKYVKHIVWDPFDFAYRSTASRKIRDARLLNCWWNYYHPGDYSELHIHSNCQDNEPHYSGVYFLDMDEPNTLEFVSKHQVSTHPGGMMFHHGRAEHATEGSVVIFPSSLMHHVRPVKKRRITLSFNIWCDFDFMDSPVKLS